MQREATKYRELVIKWKKYKTVPYHKKMHFLEEYVVQQQGQIQQQKLLDQKQVYRQIHAATLKRMISQTWVIHNYQQRHILRGHKSEKKKSDMRNEARTIWSEIITSIQISTNASKRFIKSPINPQSSYGATCIARLWRFPSEASSIELFVTTQLSNTTCYWVKRGYRSIINRMERENNKVPPRTNHTVRRRVDDQTDQILRLLL